jgi:ribosomal protein S18 acetylase RimI-like enzyme
MTKAAVDARRLEVRQVRTEDQAELAAFECGDDDLNGFLRDDALRLQQRNTVTTYLALYDGDLVGYISLMVDAVVLESKERKTLRLNHADHPVIPALKIARLATARAFRLTNLGLGTMLLRFAIARGYEIADAADCRLLTLDAYPDAIAFYDKLGFLRTRRSRTANANTQACASTCSLPTCPAGSEDGYERLDRLLLMRP